MSLSISCMCQEWYLLISSYAQYIKIIIENVIKIFTNSNSYNHYTCIAFAIFLK